MSDTITGRLGSTELGREDGWVNKPREVVVVGAGISGLAAARALQDQPDTTVTVLDASVRVGGMVETERWGGFTIDLGPEGVVTAKPEAMELISELGLDDEIVSGGPAPRQTFIARHGRLEPLPYGVLNPNRAAAINLMKSPLLSVSGKLRLALEPFVKRRREGQDESVASFVRRRFGDDLLQTIVEPLIGGIHGGDCGRLSSEMLLPALTRIEREGHSIAIAAARKGKAATPTLQRTPLVTLERGMGSLTDAMAATLTGPLKLGAKVESIACDQARWKLSLDGGTIEADQIVLALPAAASAQLLSPLDHELATKLQALPASDSQTVTFMWEEGAMKLPQRGTGFLVPRPEQRALAACTWVSEKWHHRAESGLMVRCFMRDPGSSDDQVIDAAQAEMHRLMGARAEPSRVIVRQTRAALPVMEVGHHDRVSSLHEHADRLSGLALAGGGLEGSGLPACIRSGHRAAAVLETAASYTV